jgi:hypothetical protein
MENFKHLNDIATKYAQRKKKIKDFTKLVHKDIKSSGLVNVTIF